MTLLSGVDHLLHIYCSYDAQMLQKCDQHARYICIVNKHIILKSSYFSTEYMMFNEQLRSGLAFSVVMMVNILHEFLKKINHGQFVSHK